MKDLISRQAAKNKKVYSEERHEYVVPVAEIDWLPSAQPDIARDIATIIENEQDMRVILQNAERTVTHSCDSERTETHDLVSRQAAIDAINKAFERVFAWDGTSPLGDKVLENVPSARSEPHYDEWCDDCKEYDKERHCCPRWNRVIRQTLKDAQPEQRYTEEELRVFKHGISLSLLSKRSSQHWQYDEDTATEIEFLERLYDKVSADMRGEQDDESRSNSNAQTDTRARGMGATDKSSGI